MTTPDIAGLCERLRWYRANRDGPEAAATIERQAAEIERLQEVVDELTKLDTGPKIRLRRSGPTDIRIEALKGEDQ